MKKLILTGALSLLPFGALAADLPHRGPAPEPAPMFVAPPSWSGYYVGVFGGWAQWPFCANKLMPSARGAAPAI